MVDRIRSFYQLCVIGDLPSLIKHVELYSITTEEARSEDNYAFRNACRSGHFHVAQWLSDYFGLTVEDVRSDENYALRYACKNGHLHVALKKARTCFFRGSSNTLI